MPELLDRGPGRARRARLPARALPEHAAQRQDDVGARLRRRARGRRRAQPLLERPRQPGLPAGRGRARALGRPAARRRLRRGRGARADRRPVAARWRAHEPQAAGRSARTRPTSSGGRAARSRSRPPRGGEARVLALSYGERGESGELWKEPGQTVEHVKEIRHGEAERAAAALGAELRVPRPRRLPARGRRRGARRARRQDPRVRARRADHAHRPRPVQPRPRGRVLRGRARARAGRGRGRRERVRDRHAARAAPLRAAPAGALQLHADDVRRHHAGDRAEAGGDGGDEGAGVPADLLRPARRAARQPRAPLVGQLGDPRTPRRSSA